MLNARTPEGRREIMALWANTPDGVKLINPPLDFPTGLSSPQNISWVGDGYSMIDGDDLYFYDVLGRAILNKVFTLRSGEQYWGMAYDGTDLYAKHTHSARLYRISTTNGAILNTYNQSPDRRLLGLTFNGENLVGVQAEGGDALVTISRTGNEISRVAISGVGTAQGIAFADDLYWIVESNYRGVKVFNARGVRQTDREFTWPSAPPAPSSSPAGITYDGQFLRIVEVNADRVITFKLDGTWMGGV